MMRYALVLIALAGASSAHATSFLSRSGAGALSANCPAAPLNDACPSVPNTIPVVTIGNYPIAQVWNVAQPGFNANAYVPSSSTGYGGAIANVFAQGTSAVLQAGAFTIPNANGQYAVSFAAASALYAYSYSGATVVPLPLIGSINYSVSFASPTSFALHHSFGSGTGRIAIGTSNLYKGVALLQADTVCGAADVLASSEVSGGISGFANGFVTKNFNFTLDVSIGCDGLPVTLSPGQAIYVYTFLNTYAQRGASVDATNSFHVNLAANTPPAVVAALQNSLRLVSAVPEPASWSLMIGGFAMVGVTKRRRRGMLVA